MLDDFELDVAGEQWEVPRLGNALLLFNALLTKANVPEELPGTRDKSEEEEEEGEETEEEETDEWAISTGVRAPLKWHPSTDDYEPNEAAKHEINWMDMEVETPHLRIPKWAKGPNCSDVGAVFRAPHRLPVDQKVFRQNKAKRQGSVLLDTSGSMKLGKKAIEMMVKCAPAAIIGLYGGRTIMNGAIRIVAKGGRMVIADKEYCRVGTYNGVDGPALKWLGVQPGPRIWISDGEVTGVGDQSDSGLSAIAAGICERYRIIRVDNIQAAMRLL